MKYLDLPLSPDQRVTELHIWLAIHPNGAEGIASIDIDLPGGHRRHMPLMLSRRSTAEQYEAVARQMEIEMARETGRQITMKLVTLRRVDDA